MFWLKKCPRCQGDLISESDVHGSFISCLQCGHMLTAAEEAALRQQASSTTERRPSSRRAGAA
jgi:DNA-directed RNA polymerase subunit M/transcription elongation factor TFIIS